MYAKIGVRQFRTPNFGVREFSYAKFWRTYADFRRTTPPKWALFWRTVWRTYAKIWRTYAEKAGLAYETAHQVDLLKALVTSGDLLMTSRTHHMAVISSKPGHKMAQTSPKIWSKVTPRRKL